MKKKLLEIIHCAVIRFGCAAILSLPFGTLSAADEASQVDRYNVVWDSPSPNAHGSMPIGNGDVGINAWVEPSGDLVFYVSKTDAWDEHGRLCKVGRVRVKFDPPLPVGKNFRQELKLRDGVIEITAGETKLALRVDANAPIVMLASESAQPVNCRAELELWRLRERPFKNNDDGFSGGGLQSRNPPLKVLPDTVVTNDSDQVTWYHRNTTSVYPLCLSNQNLQALEGKFKDPLLNHTFGATISGEGFVRDGDRALRSTAPRTRHALSVTVHAAQTDTPEEWLLQLQRLKAQPAFDAHKKWWRAFWERSWVFVRASSLITPPENDHPWRVGVDSGGGGRFGGEIAQPQVNGRALSAKEIAEMAGQARKDGASLRDEPFDGGYTLSAWVKPEAGESGRILDKCTSGKADGFTFDAHPGLGLRWIVGNYTMTVPDCLKAGEWQHVAATMDESTGKRCIYLNGKLLKEEGGEESVGEIINRGYVLQRFMNACSGRGGSPIKFNGSIFSVEKEPGADPETPEGNPDWRQWGANYWFQNTRLIYWPMMATGDFDLMQPFFRMYREALPINAARVETYYGFKVGAQFPETMYEWGFPNNNDYGWGNKAPEPTNSYITRYWNSNLELPAMMLDYYDFTKDAAFAKETLVPLADPLIAFLDQYWTKRVDGKIRFEPAQSLETWHVAVNPLPEIAALGWLLPRLLALPKEITTEAQRQRWKRILTELPPIPVAEENGKKILQPAVSFSEKKNSENPALYSVFPYRVFGVGKPDLELARDTYNGRTTRHNVGWCQDSIQAACLGLGEEAGKQVAGRAAQKPALRFPTMWGPNFDWIPDQDHGSNILTTLNFMLLQSVGDKIHVLPAWPKGWEVSFKLHAPGRTVVEGVYRGDKMESLKVTPESRRKDLVIDPGS